MRTIQEVGTEILNNAPKKFYVFCGSEYGIKNKYIQMLSSLYTEVHEIDDVQSVLTLMNTKHFVPLTPALYIVRYDDSFLASMNATTSDKISSTNIIGTVVCIYEDSSKAASKLEKYLPDWSVSIDSVNIQFIIKYLHSDFPKLPDRLIELSATIGLNYGDSQNICRSMMLADVEQLMSLSDDSLNKLFGKQQSSQESDIKLAIAARNFTYLNDLLNNYSGDLDSILYTILSTLVELEKILSNRHIDSALQEYTKRWTYKDIYNMFMNTYAELKKLRSYATDVNSSLIYLFSLLKFSEIPDVEVMQ